MIIAGTIQVLLNHLVRGKDPLSSVLAPRVYHQVHEPASKLMILYFSSSQSNSYRCLAASSQRGIV